MEKIKRFFQTILGHIELVYLSIFQDNLIFKPWLKNIEIAKDPSDYGLKDFSKILVKSSNNVELSIWQKEPSTNMPTFIVFHGNTGHFGDVGEPKINEHYDRRYRINNLNSLAATGSGIIAVSMSGYGLSTRVKPSEALFREDVKAVLAYIKTLDIKPENVILFGESLGAAIAILLLDEMNKNGYEPIITTLVASFSSIKNKAVDDYPEFARVNLERRIRHKFDNEKFFRETSSKTFFYLFHPEEDESTKKYHSEKLFKIAYDRGLRVEYQELKNAGHITWNAKEVATKVLEKYNLLSKKY